MSAERDVNRIVRSWIRTEEHESADRVLQTVLSKLDATPQRRSWWPSRRFVPLNKPFLVAGAAAAVLVIAILGYSLLPPVQDQGVNSTPSPTVPSVPNPTTVPIVTPTTGPVSPLEGTWATEEISCAEQDAALAAAGFTADQIARGGGTPVCPTRAKVRFTGTRLVSFNLDGSLGWVGHFRIVDSQTFEAGDLVDGLYYIRYHYVINGDTLTVDMIEDAYPGASGDGLFGEQIAQTAGWESAPFTRQP